MSERKNRSLIWRHFKKVNADTVICCICKQSKSTKGGSTGNLLRHLRKKHNNVESGSIIDEAINSSSTNAIATKRIIKLNPKPILKQIKLGSTCKSTITSLQVEKIPKLIETQATPQVVTELNSSKKEQIDNELFKMIAKTYESFDLVENKYFQKFTQALNGNYELPTSEFLCKSLMPQMYDRLKLEISTELETINAICLTINDWTSVHSEQFMSITTHFLDENGKLKSYLLDCFPFPDSTSVNVKSNLTTTCSATNLSTQLTNILSEWKILTRVIGITTKNDENFIQASQLLQISHVTCFNHTLSSIINSGFDCIQMICQKVRNVVDLFLKNTWIGKEFLDLQQQMNITTPMPLIKDCDSEWMSTYEMLNRFVRLKEPVLSVVVILNLDLEVLLQEEWTIIQKTCQLLHYFQEILNEISNENNVTISKLLIFVNFLRKKLTNLFEESEDNPNEYYRLIETIKNLFEQHFKNIEYDNILAEATFLDPRFKQHGFSDTYAWEQIQNYVKNEIYQIPIENPMENFETQENYDGESSVEKELWDDYNWKVQNGQNENDDLISAGNLELEQYLQEPTINKKTNPLIWWNLKRIQYPRLYHRVEQRLCIRPMSISGNLITSKMAKKMFERRSRLDSTITKEMIFLNYNLQSDEEQY